MILRAPFRKKDVDNPPAWSPCIRLGFLPAVDGVSCSIPNIYRWDPSSRGVNLLDRPSVVDLRSRWASWPTGKSVQWPVYCGLCGSFRSLAEGLSPGHRTSLSSISSSSAGVYRRWLQAVLYLGLVLPDHARPSTLRRLTAALECVPPVICPCGDCPYTLTGRGCVD
ncbi:hypothetical protein FA13DRAFT_1466494 [Coprinellus micaceus]|uniref:Uncharacterized protein n=1 Tax=Coprinellus micaceus TaxID=71717 RepID=A0A4Y7SM05_COPMI|nr:hypothetical protein FA13DRAFT_1466494 [Coprinellus micaceus]